MHRLDRVTPEKEKRRQNKREKQSTQSKPLQFYLTKKSATRNTRLSKSIPWYRQHEARHGSQEKKAKSKTKENPPTNTNRPARAAKTKKAKDHKTNGSKKPNSTLTGPLPNDQINLTIR